MKELSCFKILQAGELIAWRKVGNDWLWDNSLEEIVIGSSGVREQVSCFS